MAHWFNVDVDIVGQHGLLQLLGISVHECWHGESECDH